MISAASAAGVEFSVCGPAGGSAGRKGDGPTSGEGWTLGCVSAGTAELTGDAGTAAASGWLDRAGATISGAGPAAGALLSLPVGFGAVGEATGAGSITRCSIVGASAVGAAGSITAVLPAGGVVTGEPDTSAPRCRTEGGVPSVASGGVGVWPVEAAGRSARAIIASTSADRAVGA